MGPLHSVLIFGEDGPWTGSLEENRYILDNTTDPVAIKYFYVGMENGERTVSCKIAAQGEPGASGAGILYAFHQEPRFYYAFVLSPEGIVSLYKRDSEGFNQMMGVSGDYVHIGQENELKITDKEGSFYLSVNDNNIASIESINAGKGALGIVAFGTGHFVFSDFAIQLSEN